MALLETLQDNFDTPPLNPAKWAITTTGTAVTATVSGGTLNLDVTAQATANHTATVASVDTFTFTNSYIHAKVTPVTAGTSAPQTGLKVKGEGNAEQFQMFKNGATALILRLYDSGGGLVFNNTSTTYDATTMAWWRIRHTAGVVYWETAPDAAGPWTIRQQYTWTLASTVYRGVMDFAWNGATSATVAHFDNVNITPPPPVTPTSINDAETLTGPTASLGPLQNLQDDFPGSTLNPQWTITAPNGGTVTVSGGLLNLNLTTSVTSSATVTSVGAFAFTDSYVLARVYASAANNALSLLKVRAVTGGEFFQMQVFNAVLYMTAYSGSVYATDNTIPYNSTTMAWWRIRHGPGIMYFETSPDGLTWTISTQTPYTPQNTQYKLDLRAFWQSSTSGATSVKFDNINLPPAPPTSTPTSINDAQTLTGPTVILPIDTLQDTFTTGPLDTAKWSTTGIVGSTADVTAGTLNINTAAGLSAPIGTVRSVGGYTFTGSGVFAKVVPDPTALGQQTHLRVIPFAGGNEVFFFNKTGTTLTITGCDTTGTVFTTATITYDPAAHAWWKIRHTAGAIYWETSPDAITWTIRLQAVYAPQTEPYRARMYTQWTGTSTAGTVTYDNINIAPAYAAPTPITDPEALGDVTAAIAATATPDGVVDSETFGDPEAVLPAVDLTADPDGISDPETLDDPETILGGPGPNPDSIEDVETFLGPEVVAIDIVTPDPIGDTETLGNPAGSVNTAATPDPISDPETLGPPTPIRGNNIVTPDSLTDTGGLGDPTILVVPYPAYYPDSLIDIDIARPPDSLIFKLVTPWHYGEGIYSDGPYSGTEPLPEPPDEDKTESVTYGTGTYGYGIYYGILTAPPPSTPAPKPLLAPAPGYGQPPLHILGIGPWSPTIVWRGLPNHLIAKGKRAARPALAVPPATSKGFTLRLAEGSEARIDLAMRRNDAIVIDEMDTDLWWRRKDPRTKKLEVIGRFNCAHVELSTSDTGVNLSAQFEDYVTVLGARLVLEYLEPLHDPPQSQWEINTPITQILAFALPDNTGLDLSEVTGSTPYPLGKTIQKYHLPPGTSIADVMSNLDAISPVSWEWWIETPEDVNKPPKLRFALGERGEDKGVTLLDAGSGPTPIAAWTRNGAADNYANALYYTGSGTGVGKDAGGGVVEIIDAQVEQYGQRDAQYGSTTQGGVLDQIRKGAIKKLNKLADRKPTFTVTLAHGFWRGRGHIDVGDTVTLILRLGAELINMKYRVSEIVVAIDDNGMEDVTLTLGTPRASTDPRSSQSPIMRMLRTLKNYEAPNGALEIPPPEE